MRLGGSMIGRRMAGWSRISAPSFYFLFFDTEMAKSSSVRFLFLLLVSPFLGCYYHGHGHNK